MRRVPTLVSAWVALSAACTVSQPPSIPVIRLPQPPIIDGVANPEEWEGAATATELRESATARLHPAGWLAEMRIP